MTTLKHKTPCSACPMRRESLAGYLGTSTPEEFLANIHFENDMPCHCTIDYEKRDWRENQLPHAASCAGVLIFYKNQCKLPRDSQLASKVREVDADNKRVFTFPFQFLQHHDKN